MIWSAEAEPHAWQESQDAASASPGSHLGAVSSGSLPGTQEKGANGSAEQTRTRHYQSDGPKVPPALPLVPGYACLPVGQDHGLVLSLVLISPSLIGDLDLVFVVISHKRPYDVLVQPSHLRLGLPLSCCTEALEGALSFDVRNLRGWLGDRCPSDTSDQGQPEERQW